MWVANEAGNSVTELLASTGALVRVIKGRRLRFAYPFGIAADGTHVWVDSGDDRFVTEILASNGSLAKLIEVPNEADEYTDISSDGRHVWVGGSDTLTEIQASTNEIVHVIRGARYQYGEPFSIDTDGEHLWVADQGYDLTELNASTGRLIRAIDLAAAAMAVMEATSGLLAATPLQRSIQRLEPSSA